MPFFARKRVTMPPQEYVGNLHVHTPYSDGESYHSEVAQAALLSGLDFMVFTDHNLWLQGIEGYWGNDQDGHVLVLCGEEVHDRSRNPQCNHLLVFGAEREVSGHAHDLQTLIDTVNQAGGMSFIAHPDDRPIPWLREPAIPWFDRYVEHFTGLEIWNYMSRFKDTVPTRWRGLRNIFAPEEIMIGPRPQTLALWDQLLGMRRRIVGIGNADAHGTQFRIGPLAYTVFPYDFLFNCVNTHVITRMPLAGILSDDKERLYEALKQGRAFVGYDLLGSTRGFRFSAQGQNTAAIMGESIKLGHGITLQALVPARAHIKIIRFGEVVAEEENTENLTHVVREDGAYRVEVWRNHQGQKRAWILSNPIYVEPNPSRIQR
jgi:hypothetical protein